jgi:multicomponent Na+:H+ antiporter subunit E
MDYRQIKIGVARLPLFTALWLILTSGNLDQWPLALISVLAATAASVRLWPERSWRFRLVGVVRFAGYFLLQSTLGGWDVARRALQPSMPLDPGFVEHPFKLQLEEARVFFAWTVSLLPGTASASMRKDSLIVHALDRRDDVKEKLCELESYITGLFKEKKQQDLSA